MSKEYDLYLQRHKENVARGFEWLRTNLPRVIEDHPDSSWQIIFNHDQSKLEPDEYEAYDAYFYGNNPSYAVVESFKKAWLLHIHRNPHHWQHWILINDSPDEDEVCLEMPYHYIIEMVCDWWSFSWEKGDLSEIFSWYDEHKDHIKLEDRTRKTVEDILWEIRKRLGYNTLAHHGIKGQKWGVRNGPPYPLDKSGKSGRIKISEDKLTKYALDFSKDADKATAFKSALGYTKENYKKLLSDIENNFDKEKLVKKSDDGYGMRYRQIMKLKGPNGKQANVLTAWIEEDDGFRLTSVYVTDKEEDK